MLAYARYTLLVKRDKPVLQGHGRGLNQYGAVAKNNGRHAPHPAGKLLYPFSGFRHIVDVHFSIRHSQSGKYFLGSPAVATPGGGVHKDFLGIPKLGVWLIR